MPDPAAPPADPKNPPSDPPADPPAATPPAEPPADPPADPPSGKLTDLPPEVQRLIENQRRAEREAKAEAERERTARQALEREKLDAKERAEAEAADAKADAAKARQEANEARLAVRLAGYSHTEGEGEEAKTIKIADAELATDALLKRGLKFTDSGEPENFDEAVKSLLAERPVLAATQGETPAPPAPTPAPQPNGGPGGSGGETPPQLTAEQVQAANRAGKTPEEWAALQNVTNIEDWERLQQERQQAATG